MSLFYVLPPRPLLGEHFAASLRGLFPGVDWDTRACAELAEALAAAILEVLAGARTPTYAVARDRRDR